MPAFPATAYVNDRTGATGRTRFAVAGGPPSRLPSFDMPTAADRYLELLARTLTRYGMSAPYRPVAPRGLNPVTERGWDLLRRVLARQELLLARPIPYSDDARRNGRDWPFDAETMIGLRRLENVRYCIERILTEGVPGDLLEAGVWRGGAAIYMAAVLETHGATDRNVWLADSFAGLPAPDTERYGRDVENFSSHDYLAVSLDQVRANFERYGLLGGNIRFLEGWFTDTMPSAPITRLSLLRLDGDLYSSTMDVLVPMYDKVEVGGFVIIDDYGTIPECRSAVCDFRAERGIQDEIMPIDGSGVYWRKS